MPRASDLESREVINVADGKRLGGVSDVEFNLEDGRITAIVVPGGPRVFGLFSRDSECVIGWDKIKKIGSDVILVDIKNYPD